MKKLVFLLLISGPVLGQNYAFQNIDKTLVDPAKVVVRNYEFEFEVHNISTATQRVKRAVTILNESAKAHAVEYVHYDADKKIKSMSATLYDKTGKEVRKLKKSEILDQSSVSGFSIYEDDRVKIMRMSYPSYPFTVEFEYELEIEGLLFYPRWYPQYSSSVSVEKASFTMELPLFFEFRYHQRNVALDPQKNVSGGQNKYVWRIADVPAFKPEPYGPPLNEVVPSVLTAPNLFEMGGYAGSLETWKDMGLWQNSLNEGLDALPASTKAEVLELTKGLNKREATKAVYEYMQNRTRYVSIQLGIGGWQPFSATYVDENGYGDCKALTNYTKSLLEVAGIPSIYTLVRAGRNEANIITDFPSSQFNHVILAVPMEKDTVWLECTSQTNPFGYAGSFTGDRDVLLITEQGGVITHTPVYDVDDNTQTAIAEVVLDKDGFATATLHTRFQGLQYDNRRHQVTNSREEQEEWLYKNLSVNDFDIMDVRYQEFKTEIPAIDEEVTIRLKNPVAMSGKRLFFKPNLFNRRNSWPKELEQRKNDVVTTVSYRDVDSIHFVFPDGVFVEFVPEPVSIETRFGSYEVTCTVDENGLWYVRRMELLKGTHEPDTYPELVEFLKSISKADNAKAVLKKAT